MYILPVLLFLPKLRHSAHSPPYTACISASTSNDVAYLKINTSAAEATSWYDRLALGVAIKNLSGEPRADGAKKQAISRILDFFSGGGGGGCAG